MIPFRAHKTCIKTFHLKVKKAQKLFIYFEMINSRNNKKLSKEIQLAKNVNTVMCD